MNEADTMALRIEMVLRPVNLEDDSGEQVELFW
jgi:hypothetical protein